MDSKRKREQNDKIEETEELYKTKIRHLEKSVEFYKNSFFYLLEMNELNTYYTRSLHEAILVVVPEDKRKQLCSYLLSDYKKFMSGTDTVDSKYFKKN